MKETWEFLMIIETLRSAIQIFQKVNIGFTMILTGNGMVMKGIFLLKWILLYHWMDFGEAASVTKLIMKQKISCKNKFTLKTSYMWLKLKNWCFWTVVLEKTLESPLDCKEMQPVHSKGDQPWVFFGRTDAKADTPVLWPPHVKSWLIGKDSDAGRDCGQEEKGTTEDEMAGWHHRLDGRESEWTPGAGWWTGRPGVLRFMGSQRVGHDWATELNWMDSLGSLMKPERD